MDDPRIEWIRDRVNHALLIDTNDVFDELINREDGEAELQIGKFLNETPENDEAAIIFYKVIMQVEEEYEVECGMYMWRIIYNIHKYLSSFWCSLFSI